MAVAQLKKGPEIGKTIRAVANLVNPPLNLENLIAQGESQTVEFKKSLGLRREGLESLCGMINADIAHGTVIFGVENDGSVCGIEQGNLDKAQRTLSQAIDSGFDPPITAEIKISELNDRQILGLTAKRSTAIPLHEYDGRAWIRQGTETRRLSLSQRQQLERKRNRDLHIGPWRCDKCGAMVGQLISFEVTNEGMVKNYRCRCGGEFWPAI